MIKSLLLLLLAVSSLHGYMTKEPTVIKKHLRKITLENPSSGMPPIDCIYVINLDERPERLAKIREALTGNHLLATRVSAINGWKLPSATLQQLSGSYPIRMNGGHYGCLLSHLSILQDAYERGFKTIWILEDDAEFVGQIALIPKLINELQLIDNKWDALFTDPDFRDRGNGYIKQLATDPRPGQILHDLSYYTNRTKVSPHLLKIASRYGTHSFILSRRGIEKMLHYFSHVYIWCPIDVDMHYIPGFREYASIVDIVTNSRAKTISDTSDRSPLKEEVIK